MKPEQANSVWSCFAAGNDVATLGLGIVDGRVDLRGLRAPHPVIHGTQTVGSALVQHIGNTIVLRGVTWRGLNFSGAQLPSLGFFDCVIENCVFDDAICREWRVFGTHVKECSFKKADLRGAALGGLDGLKRNSFEKVDFTKSDLRESAHGSADFRHCDFSRANLKKVDFRGDVFEECRFAGVLEVVTFARFCFTHREKPLPPNEMTRVDMRDATLRSVSFQNQDLKTTLLPEDEDHIIVDRAPEVLAAIAAHFAACVSESDRRWAFFFEGMKAHVGTGSRTVFHRKDLLKLGGEETVRVVREINERMRAEASKSPPS